MGKDLEIYMLSDMKSLSWVYSLFVNLNRPMIFNVVNLTKNVECFGKLLPMIKEIKNSDLNIEEFEKLSSEYSSLTLEKWSEIDEPIYFSTNSLLENENQIDDLLPIEYNYHYNIPVPGTSEKLFENKPYIVFHIRSMSEIKRTKSWEPFAWAELANNIRYFYPEVKFVLIGDENDADAINHLNIYMKFHNITDSIALIGPDLEKTIQVIRDANYVVSWASVIGVISTVVKTPISMCQFQPSDLWKYNWVSPQMKKDYSYMAFDYTDTPQYVFEQIQKTANIGQYLNA